MDCLLRYLVYYYVHATEGIGYKAHIGAIVAIIYDFCDGYCGVLVSTVGTILPCVDREYKVEIRYFNFDFEGIYLVLVTEYMNHKNNNRQF